MDKAGKTAVGSDSPTYLFFPGPDDLSFGKLTQSKSIREARTCWGKSAHRFAGVRNGRESGTGAPWTCTASGENTKSRTRNCEQGDSDRRHPEREAISWLHPDLCTIFGQSVCGDRNLSAGPELEARDITPRLPGKIDLV